MRIEIKERIEKIKNKELPQGYRKIGDGVYPIDWKKVKMEEIFNRVNNPVLVEKDKLYQEIGIRSHGKGIFHKEHKLGVELGNKRVFWIEPNVFIVNIVFAWEQAIAKTTEKEFGMIASHRFPMYKPVKDVLDLEYITYYFKTKRGKEKLELASPGGAGRNKTLGQKEFDRLEIVLPKIEEQIKISTILSKWDEGILKQEKLIEAKKKYKKGMMQKIFSQKPRFKDEDGNDYPGWEEKTLGEIGVFQTSSVDKLYIEGEKEVKLVNYMNVYKHEKIDTNSIKNYQIVTAKNSQIESSNLLKGDILFTPSSETPEDIGHSVVIFENLDKCVFSYHLIRFRPRVKLNILYSHYFCNTESVLSQITRLATGSTRFTISVKSFSSIKILLPSFSEQEKIGNFLSIIDREIELLERELSILKNEKQSLMSMLLNGIVRTV